jgi:alpha-beta hydrolase superfamily lysophospholipase
MWGLTLAAVLAFTVGQGSVERSWFAVQSQDGVELGVWAYTHAGDAPRPTIIVTSDGHAGVRARDTRSLAESLFLRGFDVAIWDRRGIGNSGGYYDFGASDAVDLQHIADAVAARTRGAPVGLVGVGSGGAASLQAAVAGDTVKAVAVYGVGRGGPGVVDGLWARWVNPGSFWGRWLWRLRGVRIAADFPGQPSSPHDAASAVRNLGRLPVLVSAGGQMRVELTAVEELYRAARPPREWVYIPTARSFPPVQAWGNHLQNFFGRHL